MPFESPTTGESGVARGGTAGELLIAEERITCACGCRVGCVAFSNTNDTLSCGLQGGHLALAKRLIVSRWLYASIAVLFLCITNLLLDDVLFRVENSRDTIEAAPISAA